MYEGFDKVKELFLNVATNIASSFYDKYIEANVEQKVKNGMKSVIIRRQVRKCCEWCANLAGIYEYGDAPDEVYQRHDNCKCLVTFYSSKDKTYQDVWSKKEYDSQKEARIAKIKDIERTIPITSKYSVDKEYLNNYKKGTIEYEIYEEAHESKIGEIVREKYGGNIIVKKAIENNDGIKNPDFIWNGRLWEHKASSSKTSVDSQTRKAIKQIQKNPGGLILEDESGLEIGEILSIIKHRLQRTNVIGQMDVIIIRNEKIMGVYRIKK